MSDRTYHSTRYYRVMNFLVDYSLHLSLVIIALVTLVPFLIIISASFSEESALIVEGFGFLPRQFSTTAYQFVINKPDRLVNAYIVTLSVTVLGTAIALLMMSMLAYPLSRRQFRLRKGMSFYVFFTTLFTGGLVPYYILVSRYLNLKNTFLILLLPQMVSVFQVLLLKAYFSQLPEELFDAARVDGASEWRTFWEIAMPLARPALATIGLMTALAYWNNWTTALYFITDPKLYTLQYFLAQIMNNAQTMALEPQIGDTPMPMLTARFAIVTLATGPAAFAFLFAQKYLVRSITLGSVK
jgi:putative aldouronate transport system permease protein